MCFNCTRLNRACLYEFPSIDYHSQQPTHLYQTTSAATGIPVTYNDGFVQGNAATSPNTTFDVAAQDAQTSPGCASVSFDTMVGEWGDIFSADTYQELGLQLSPQYGSEDISLGFAPAMDSTTQFAYFVNHVQLPFIVPWDEGNWIHAKLEIAQMASRNPQISATVIAVENLYETLDKGGETADTLPAYFTAKAGYTLTMKNGQLSIDELFVMTFLLCCFEVVAQQETVSSTLKQKDALVAALEAAQDQKPWSTLVQRIIIWLHLFHAKALHLGGRGILSPKILSLLQDQQNAALCLRSSSSSTGLGSHPATQSLQQALFQFYLELQRISILAASMNRHHRPRGAPAVESQVDRISCTIARQLENLWQGRPAILDCNMAELSRGLQCSKQDLAHISLLSRLCKLCYNAEIIYYCRSQGRVDTLQKKILPAREEMRELIHEMEAEANGETLLCQAALAWPLFLYAVESKCQEEATWALAKFESIRNPLWHTEFVKTFVRDLTEEQLRKGERVDSRFFCVEKYGIVPPFL